jgi:hypothetical protein
VFERRRFPHTAIAASEPARYSAAGPKCLLLCSSQTARVGVSQRDVEEHRRRQSTPGTDNYAVRFGPVEACLRVGISR